MTITQSLEGQIIAAHSPNILIIDDVVGNLEIATNIPSVGSFTFNRIPYNGTVKIDLYEITKQVYRKGNYLDPYDYTTSGLQSYMSGILSITLTDDSSGVNLSARCINASLQPSDGILDTLVDQPLSHVSCLDLKIWDGYPHSTSVLKFTGVDRNLNHDGGVYSAPLCAIDLIEGCEGQYIKWLNDLGGYSYWLFNPQYRDSVKTKSLGDTVNTYDNRLTAISRTNSRGSEAQVIRKLTAKIDKLYARELQSLMYSPEIYLYTGVKGSGVHAWVKVTIPSGSFQMTDSKYNSIDLKLSIEFPELYTLKR